MFLTLPPNLKWLFAGAAGISLISDGQPRRPDTPLHIVENLCTVAQRENTHGYSTSHGIQCLRRAISRWHADRYAVDIDPESEAIVTIGSKESLAHLVLATPDHGDTVLVQNPSYPIHIHSAVIAGAKCGCTAGGRSVFRELERAIRESIPTLKMMILGFPSNLTAQWRLHWIFPARRGVGVSI